MNWDEYLRDSKTQDAVVRNLEVIGDAARIFRMSFETSIRVFRGEIWSEPVIA
jgi:uncharacterized protein with HEPN domain